MYYENFKGIAAELIATVSSDKGRVFWQGLADQIEARGAEWIEANAAALNIRISAEAARPNAPVSDNRMFFLNAWKKALGI